MAKIEKAKNLTQYFEAQEFTRDDLKEMILRSSLALLMECAHNFDGDARETEKAAQPLFFLNQILDEVE